MKTIKITADGTVEQVEINGYDELKGHLDGPTMLLPLLTRKVK